MNLFSLKILDIILIFLGGFFGSTFILFFKSRQEEFGCNENIFLFLKLFSAGIILGTGCVHMLPEARILLESISNSYPYSDFIFGISIITIMSLEEVIKNCFHKSKQNHSDLHTEIKLGSHLTYNSTSNIDVELQNTHTNIHKKGEHCHTVNILYQEDPDLKKIITLYILEFGMAIHSIIIGFTIGTTTSKDILTTLSVAITFHQIFEGIALGSAITQCKGVSRLKSFLIILIYSITTPLGIGIGLITGNSELTNNVMTQGIFNAISAGILVYMALIHFIIEDYINNEATGLKKFCMFLSLGFGYGLMAILGIWS